MTRGDIKRRVDALRQLPARPDAIHAFLARAAAPVSPVELRIAAAVDWGLALALHAAARPLGARTLTDAVTRLGAEACRSVALERLRTEPGVVSYVQGARHAFASALGCAALASRAPGIEPDVAFDAGLFHNVGKLALYAACPEALEKSGPASLRTMAGERDVFGADHTLAGKWLLQRFGFPEEVVCAAWLHHHPPGALDGAELPARIIDLVALANALASINRPGQIDGLLKRPTLAQRLERLVLEPGVLHEVWGDVLDKAAVAGQDRPSPAIREMRPFEWLGAEALDSQRRLREELAHRQTSQRRLERTLETLARLATGMSPEECAREIAEAIQHAFGAAPGICLLRDADGAVCATATWKTRSAPVRLVPTGGPREALDELARNGGGFQLAGLIAVPIIRAGAIYGQILLDTQSLEPQAHPPDIKALQAFAEHCAPILAMRRTLEREQAQCETFAAALMSEAALPAAKPATPPAPPTSETEIPPAAIRAIANLAQAIHDPLAVIQGRARILHSSAKNPEEQKALGVIVEQSRLVSRAVKDLLDYACPAEPKAEPALINYTLRQLLQPLRPRFDVRGIHLTETYAEGLPRVSVDTQLLRQALQNIITNAEEALGRKGGELIIRTEPAPERRGARIVIEDSGPGFPPDKLDKVCAPFFTTKPAGDGAGLGLAVAKRIVEAHKGSLQVENAPGGGARVIMTFPPAAAVAPQAALGAAPAAAPVKARGSRPLVLVFDRSADMREVLAEVLRARDYDCVTASSADETLQRLRDERPDVAALEIPLHGDEPMDLLSRAQAAAPGVPIIAMIGPASREEWQRALAKGACACLRKPFQLRQLLADVDRALKQPREASG